MLFSFLQTWPKKLLSFKGILNLYFPITVFTSRNWNQKKQSALAFLTKVFTMLIVTMQNTGKAPRFLILHIKKKNQTSKTLKAFQIYYLLQNVNLHYNWSWPIVMVLRLLQKACVNKRNLTHCKWNRNIRWSLRLNGKPMLMVEGKAHLLHLLQLKP